MIQIYIIKKFLYKFKNNANGFKITWKAHVDAHLYHTTFPSVVKTSQFGVQECLAATLDVIESIVQNWQIYEPANNHCRKEYSHRTVTRRRSPKFLGN